MRAGGSPRRFLVLLAFDHLEGRGILWCLILNYPKTDGKLHRPGQTTQLLPRNDHKNTKSQHQANRPGPWGRLPAVHPTRTLVFVAICHSLLHQLEWGRDNQLRPFEASTGSRIFSCPRLETHWIRWYLWGWRVKVTQQEGLLALHFQHRAKL